MVGLVVKALSTVREVMGSNFESGLEDGNATDSIFKRSHCLYVKDDHSELKEPCVICLSLFVRFYFNIKKYKCSYFFFI